MNIALVIFYLNIRNFIYFCKVYKYFILHFYRISLPFLPSSVTSTSFIFMQLFTFYFLYFSLFNLPPSFPLFNLPSRLPFLSSTSLPSFPLYDLPSFSPFLSITSLPSSFPLYDLPSIFPFLSITSLPSSFPLFNLPFFLTSFPLFNLPFFPPLSSL